VAARNNLHSDKENRDFRGRKEARACQTRAIARARDQEVTAFRRGCIFVGPAASSASRGAEISRVEWYRAAMGKVDTPFALRKNIPLLFSQWDNAVARIVRGGDSNRYCRYLLRNISYLRRSRNTIIRLELFVGEEVIAECLIENSHAKLSRIPIKS